MSWAYLVLAIVFEVAGTTCMKLSDGFARLWPSIGVGGFYFVSITFLTLALKRIDLSIAYAVWAGAGIAMIALVGVVWFKEPVTAIKAGCVALIIVGVVGLNLSESGH